MFANAIHISTELAFSIAWYTRLPIGTQKSTWTAVKKYNLASYCIKYTVYITGVWRVKVCAALCRATRLSGVISASTLTRPDAVTLRRQARTVDELGEDVLKSRPVENAGVREANFHRLIAELSTRSYFFCGAARGAERKEEKAQQMVEEV